MKSFSVCILAAVLLLSVAQQTIAVPVVFTDRELWEASVSVPVVVEDFESEPVPLNNPGFPYTTAGGITLDWPSGGSTGSGPLMEIVGNGRVNYSQEVLYRGSGSQSLSVTFDNITGAQAFGFEYYYPDPTIWELHTGSEVITLPSCDVTGQQSLFVGIIDTAGLSTSFLIMGIGRPKEKLSIDNIAYSPIPEPCTVLLLGIGLVGMRRRLNVRRQRCISGTAGS